MRIEIDGVLFDNDGVIVDSHAETERGWRQLAVEFDLDADQLVAELAGVRAADTLGRHLDGERLTAAVARLDFDSVVARGGDLGARVGHGQGPRGESSLASMPVSRRAIR